MLQVVKTGYWFTLAIKPSNKQPEDIRHTQTLGTALSDEGGDTRHRQLVIHKREEKKQVLFTIISVCGTQKWGGDHPFTMGKRGPPWAHAYFT